MPSCSENSTLIDLETPFRIEQTSSRSGNPTIRYAGATASAAKALGPHLCLEAFLGSRSDMAICNQPPRDANCLMATSFQINQKEN